MIAMCKLVSMKTNYGEIVEVADVKVKTISKICEIAKACPKIDYIYIFGSSVDDRCTSESDIDIAIVSNVTRSILFEAQDYDRFTTDLYNIDDEQEYDILQFNSLDALKQKKERVCKDILNKGKLIYMREGA